MAVARQASTYSFSPHVAGPARAYFVVKQGDDHFSHGGITVPFEQSHQAAAGAGPGSGLASVRMKSFTAPMRAFGGRFALAKPAQSSDLLGITQRGSR